YPRGLLAEAERHGACISQDVLPGYEEALVYRRRAAELYAAREHAAARAAVHRFLDRAPYALGGVGHPLAALDVHSQDLPADDVRPERVERGYFIVLDGYQVRALGSRLAYMTPLEVTGEYYVRPFV